eukprot:8877571-Ditylum_brightwellii.AAC.1
MGEWEATLEEYSYTHGRNGSNSGGGMRQRAVVVRSGGGHILHASFSLPSSGRGETKAHPSSSFRPNQDVPLEEEEEVQDPILCWAYFRNHETKQNDKDEKETTTLRTNHSTNSKPKTATTTTTRKLCVLSGPSTLRILDVHPSSSSEQHPKARDSSAAGGGDGHTITLPFEACAIYPLPKTEDGGGGLLIQRIVTAEDTDVQQQYQYPPPSQQN